jgi:RDD family
MLTWLTAAMVAVVALVLFGYGFCFEVLLGGQTPGKRQQKLRVLRDNGTPATTLDLAIRNLLRIVDSLPGFYAVGGFVAILNAQQKRLGDLAAGTIVVKEGELDYRANADKKKAVEVAPVPIANVALDAEELRLIRGFLERRTELIPEARSKLAEQLGRRMHAKHGGQYDDGEVYLLRLSEGRHFES